MATLLERVVGLLRLVVDEGTSNEEQRTAAVTACRIIYKNDLLRTGIEVRESKKQRKRRVHEEQVKEQVRADKQHAQEQFIAQVNTDPASPCCDICKVRIAIGDLIIFRYGFPFVHMTCYKRWKAGQ